MNPVIDSIPRLCGELAKNIVKVSLHGDDIMIPKEKVGVLSTIVTHILNNAIDHGIEDDAVRAQKNKPSSGQIIMEAREEKGVLRLIIEDDGKGLDLVHLKALGKEQKLVLDDATDMQIAEVIFYSGVSTATDVSDISGRGVGMDAVKGFLEHNGGSIQIQFTGEIDINGCVPFKYEVRLPLTSH